jgi:hypothetical protein
MAFSGDLVDYPLAELLFFFGSNHRSGWLTIQNDVSQITFTLVQGKLIAANSDDLNDRLGQRLIAEGVINVLQLETALAIQALRESSKSLGLILEQMGYASAEDVRGAVRAQSIDLMFQILVHPPCLFFYERGLPEAHDIEAGIALEHDVLDALRQADEWLTHQLWIASVQLNPDTSADMLIGVISQDWPAVEAMLDGATNLNEVAAATGWSLTEAHQSLRRLQSVDIVFLDRCSQHQEHQLLPAMQADSLAAAQMD